VIVADGCAYGIGLLVVGAAVMFALTTWPAYVLGALRVSEDTVVRIRRTVVRTSLALLVLAIAGAALLGVEC
jgi:hypothetical protein